MGKIDETTADCFFETVTKDGVTLEVISSKKSEGEWTLEIKNEKGVSTNWFDTYPTADAAIDAGIEAIEKEGVKEFASTDGFGYL